MTRYFLLHCEDPFYGFFLEDEIRRKGVITRDWLCVSCNRPYPDKAPTPERLAAAQELKGPLSGLEHTGALLARRAFLDLACNGAVDKHFQHAPLLDAKGAPFEDWEILVGRHAIVVKSAEDISGWPCDSCGRRVYAAGHYPFVLPPPPEDIEIFDAGRYRLLVIRSVLDRVLTRAWPGLSIQEIEARDTPPEEDID